MGYTPDPMLSSLYACRQASRSSPYQGTVAWITNFPTRDGWRKSTYLLERRREMVWELEKVFARRIARSPFSKSPNLTLGYN